MVTADCNQSAMFCSHHHLDLAPLIGQSLLHPLQRNTNATVRLCVIVPRASASRVRASPCESVQVRASLCESVQVNDQPTTSRRPAPMRFVAVERGGTRWHAFCDVCQRPANDQQTTSKRPAGGQPTASRCGCVWLSVELSVRPVKPVRRLKAARSMTGRDRAGHDRP